MTAVSVHDVLLRPVISEKSVTQTERNNYTFAVAPRREQVPDQGTRSRPSSR